MSELLLDSLEIKGYRCFRDLTIEKLGRVNLIVGKNNVGKTALLEALWIWAETTSWESLMAVLQNVLKKRNETIPKQYTDGIDFRHLFFNRPSEGICEFSISNRKYLPRVIEEWEENPAKNENIVGLRISLSSNNTKGTKINSFDLVAGEDRKNRDFYHEEIKNIFLETQGLNNEFAAEIWDEIIYQIKEDEVVKALKIILDKLVDINFNSYPKGADNRVPVVRVEGINERVPLKSLGEGMNRLLGIALVLVDCENGVLLIDEIESGLHYSVLPDVWKLIFKTAKDLNVQVFATTHSLDCIRAFTKVATENEEKDDGMSIRLIKKDEQIQAVVLNEENLEIAVENDFEVR